MIVNLVRTESGKEGTFGKLIINQHILSTVELPWEDNEKNISCIPYGTYNCVKIHSPKYGDVFQVMSVPNRTHILFHWGNWAGDEEAGFRSDSDGCILVGLERAVIRGQKAVASSKIAIRKMNDFITVPEFTLVVSGMDIW